MILHVYKTVAYMYTTILNLQHIPPIYIHTYIHTHISIYKYLCNKSAECKYLSAFNNCQIIYFLWTSANIPARITA